MSKMFLVVLCAFGVFAAYHYWPTETKHVGTRIVDVAKAGYAEARK